MGLLVNIRKRKGIICRRDVVAEKVREACETYGKDKKFFIPNASQGLPVSTFPGVYEAISEEIDKMSKEMF